MVATNHLDCPLCKKNVSWPCFGKHMMSYAHIEQFLKPALLREGKDAIASFKKSSKTRGLPYITVNGDMLFFCLGCKKAGKNNQNTLTSDHLRTCPQADKHLETLNALLEIKEEVKQQPIEQNASSEEFLAMKKELEKERKKRIEAENDRDALLETNEELEEAYKKAVGMGRFDFEDKYKDAIEEGNTKTLVAFLEGNSICETFG